MDVWLNHIYNYILCSVDFVGRLICPKRECMLNKNWNMYANMCCTQWINRQWYHLSNCDSRWLKPPYFLAKSC